MYCKYVTYQQMILEFGSIFMFVRLITKNAFMFARLFGKYWRDQRLKSIQNSKISDKWIAK